MTHFIIRLVGISVAQVRKAGDFHYVEAHDCLCYEGREIPLAEFNELVPRVLERYRDYLPRLPQIVLLDRPAESAPVPAEISAPDAAPAVSGDVSGEPPVEPAAEAPAPDPSAAGAEDPAPAPPKSKGGRPRKYGQGGVIKT
jgi:hypothetical protein